MVSSFDGICQEKLTSMDGSHRKNFHVILCIENAKKNENKKPRRNKNWCLGVIEEDLKGYV